MNKSEFTQMQYRDLYHAYKHCYANSSGACRMNDILEKALNMPTRRFYVSAEEAYENYSLIKNGKPMTVTSELRKMMYQEIYDRVQMRLKSGDKSEAREIIESVIEDSAPRFYIKLSSAKVMISNYFNKTKRKKRDQNG